MGTPALTREEMAEALDLYEKLGTEPAVAQSLGISRGAASNRIRRARLAHLNAGELDATGVGTVSGTRFILTSAEKPSSLCGPHRGANPCFSFPL